MSGLVASNFLAFLSDLVLFLLFFVAISILLLNFTFSFNCWWPSLTSDAHCILKYEFTVNGLLASSFLALRSTLLLLAFFGVAFLVAILSPHFILNF
jgi:hypothetical protein